MQAVASTFCDHFDGAPADAARGRIHIERFRLYLGNPVRRGQKSGAAASSSLSSDIGNAVQQVLVGSGRRASHGKCSEAALRRGSVRIAIGLVHDAKTKELHIQSGVAIQGEVLKLMSAENLSNRDLHGFERRRIR